MDKTGQVQRRISLRLIMLALIISGLIFAVGVLVGVQLAGQAENSLQTDLSNLDAQTSFLEVASLTNFSSNQSSLLCPVYAQQLGLFDNQTEQFRLKLDFLSTNDGPSDPEVQQLETSYAYLEARDYLNLLRTTSQCGVKFNSALFFYAPNCPVCDNELASLAQIKRQSNFSVFIYSLDTSINHPAVEALQAYYNVTNATMPVTVLNGQVIYGAQTPQYLSKFLVPQ
jgi:hypothetical protein